MLFKIQMQFSISIDLSKQLLSFLHKLPEINNSLSKRRIFTDNFSFFESCSSVIDVFAGRQRRDRSIGKEVKVEPRESQGNAFGAVRPQTCISSLLMTFRRPTYSQCNDDTNYNVRQSWNEHCSEEIKCVKLWSISTDNIDNSKNWEKIWEFHFDN